MLKPTGIAVRNWESLFNGVSINLNDDPSQTSIEIPGVPGDFYRGYNVSYSYIKSGVNMDNEEIQDMLEFKRDGYLKESRTMMENVDTVIYKYTFGKTEYDQDRHFSIFRAASIHLYTAEIYFSGVKIEALVIGSRMVLIKLGSGNSAGLLTMMVLPLLVSSW